MKIKIHCPDCDTSVPVPEDEAEEKLANHNDSLHSGEPVAGMGPDAVPFEEYQSETVDPLEVHSMGEDAGPVGEHPDGVRVGCKACSLVALFPTEHEAAEASSDHDDIKHGGDYESGLVKWDIEPLPDSRELIENIGLGKFVEIFGPSEV